MVSHAHSLVERGGIACRRIRDAQAIEQVGEPVAILRKVDGVGSRPHDRHARLFERARQLQRSLPAEGGNDAIGTLRIDDVHDVLVRERLEIQPVGRVVVGRDRLGVAIHHDGLVSGFRKRITRMHAAVVELDALPDAVGTGTQDEGLGLGTGGDELGFACIVGLVVVRRRALEFSGAGVDGFECGHHPERLAPRAHDDLARMG